MYIGEFSKKLGVSADTIRYYINIGLLLPQKINNKYDFQEDCIDRMKEILHYKNLNFTLDEINELLNVKNAFLNINQSNQKYVLDFLMDKQDHIKEDINKLQVSYDMLQEKIEKIKQVNVAEEKQMGIPVNFLHYLACPQCGESLYAIDMDPSSYIYNGDLKCYCGHDVSIKDGIINARSLVDVEQENHSNIIDSMQQNLVDYYKENYNSKIMNQIQVASNQCVLKHIKNKKIILSMGISPGKMLNNILSNLDEESYYVMIDHNYHYLKYIKQNIDFKQRNNVIFIYGDMEHLPLKHHMAHLIIDLCNTDYRALYNHDRGIHICKNYLNTNGLYLICFCTIKPNSKTAWILRRELKKNFMLENIRENFKDHGFINKESQFIGSLPFHSIFLKGIYDIDKEIITKLHPNDSIHMYWDLYELSKK